MNKGGELVVLALFALAAIAVIGGVYYSDKVQMAPEQAQKILVSGKIDDGKCVYDTKEVEKIIRERCTQNSYKENEIISDGESGSKKEPPICLNIGTRSEGWHQNDLRISWDSCSSCIAVCKNNGMESEGWYSSCSDNLIKYEDCW